MSKRPNPFGAKLAGRRRVRVAVVVPAHRAPRRVDALRRLVRHVRLRARRARAATGSSPHDVEPAVLAAARRVLPLRLGRQPAARPRAEGLGVVPAHVDDRVVRRPARSRAHASSCPRGARASARRRRRSSRPSRRSCAARSPRRSARRPRPSPRSAPIQKPRDSRHRVARALVLAVLVAAVVARHAAHLEGAGGKEDVREAVDGVALDGPRLGGGRAIAAATHGQRRRARPRDDGAGRRDSRRCATRKR